jgi:hypothetical protein
MRLIERVLVAALAFLVGAGSALADSVRVRVASANVRSAPTTASRVVATAREGDVLDLLGESGAWRHVRTRDGADGWISSGLVEPVPAAVPATPTAAPSPAPSSQASAPPPAPPATEALSIDHKAVGCIVAEEYPRLEACFAPAATLGRAQIQFRAAGTSPWYAVDMKAEGPCYMAWLPKPKKDTTSIEYFVFAIDKAFAESLRPEKAPGEPFAPRVVRKRSECEPLKAVAAWSAKAAPRILVNVARDAGGKVLDAAAQAAGAPSAGMTGFSADGVVFGNPTAATGSSSGSAAAAGAGAAAAGHGISTLAIVGGVAAAGGLVAVAASKSGGSSSSSSSGSGGSSAPSSAPLSGAWAGSAAAGSGLTAHFTVTGVGDCSYGWDVTTNLVQSGTVVSGPITTTFRTLSCNPADLQGVIDPVIHSLQGTVGSGTFTATVSSSSSSGSITIPFGTTSLNGTYTPTLINATGQDTIAGYAVQYTMKLAKVSGG